MTRSKHILFFNSNPDWGGGEKWHLEMATALNYEGYKVFVASLPDSQLIQQSKERGLCIYPIRIGNFSFLNPFKAQKIARWIRHQKIDMIILNLPSDLKCAGVAAKQAGVPRIVYRRGSAIPIKNSIFNRWTLKHVVTDVLVNSKETGKTILANNPNLIPEEKIHLIYNGIKLDEYDRQQSVPIYQEIGGAVVLGNAGRMVDQKGQFDLLEMAARLQKDKVNFKLIIAGDGKLNHHLKQKAKELSVADRVLFPGFVEDIKTFMLSIDVFVLSSRWEGFGYVLAEAAASEKPIVAYEISSNPELVAHETTGYLVELKNIDQLTEKVKALIENPLLRKTLGQQGRQRVEEKFDFSKNFKNFVKWVG